ncbi:hypothetical protein JCM19235_1862 [Vibrio maritimus]|uniref:Uncharacterized protein n=2 Tax=Vibrio TaxID=662 RepID=A0A090RW45_9VIBR|nr:hypothetical protein JCM19235_1862 [Vibrio maritimus]GAL25409.1 hypothetical protein JCM19239_6329 [Vibrio variabilis]
MQPSLTSNSKTLIDLDHFKKNCERKLQQLFEIAHFINNRRN